MNLANDGFRRLPLPLEPGLDAFLRALLCFLRVLDRLLLVADLAFQFGDLLLDARPFGRRSARQVAVGILQTLSQRVQCAFCRPPPAHVLTQPGQAGIEVLPEVDRLTRLQSEGQLDVPVEEEWDDRSCT